jgi:hypothetical protein
MKTEKNETLIYILDNAKTDESAVDYYIKALFETTEELLLYAGECMHGESEKKQRIFSRCMDLAFISRDLRSIKHEYLRNKTIEAHASV